MQAFSLSYANNRDPPQGQRLAGMMKAQYQEKN